MAANFQAFWEARRSVPAERLNDVGRTLLREGVPAMPVPRYLRPERVQAARAEASDADLVRERFVEPAFAVGAVRYIADLPQKHRRERRDDDALARAAAVVAQPDARGRGVDR